MTSAPNHKKVFASLSKLLRSLNQKPGARGLVLECGDCAEKFIVFSDHHKGNRDQSDDFANNEPAYLDALNYYLTNKFKYINLGDSEELWKYTPQQVISKNIKPLLTEAEFQKVGNYYKTFGNHDLTWKNKLDVDICFKNIFTLPLPVYEGMLIKMEIEEKPISVFLTHGHQGDDMSDNNAFSTWIVSHIWRPIQRYLRININTPAKDYRLKGKHNVMMYEWSSRRKNLVLITGHTHTPVFASGKYSDHPNNDVTPESKPNKKHIKPSYFNSGCCCYNDGNITGIEIVDGMIRLVRWHHEPSGSERTVLEEVSLRQLISDLDD